MKQIRKLRITNLQSERIDKIFTEEPVIVINVDGGFNNISMSLL